MQEELSRILKERWGVTGEIRHLRNRVWAIDDRYLLKVGENTPQFLWGVEMTDFVRLSGTPAPEIIPTADGGLTAEAGDTACFLMKKLPGRTIPNIFQAEDPRAVLRETGGVLAGLHNRMDCAQRPGRFWRNSLLDEMKSWVYQSFADHSFSLLPREELDGVIGELERANPRLPRQLIHRDLHYGNLLFVKGVRISGCLDFDLFQENIRLFDLCYLLGSLLSQVTEARHRELWFELIGQLYRSYGETASITETERESTGCVMGCICLLFAAYYTNEGNPELARGSMEHYRLIADSRERILDAVK